MANRREFSREVYGQIILRATKEGRTYCEKCGVLCKPGQFHIDHIDPDGMQIDKSRKLTADDGQLLCTSVCHPIKTAQDVADIARAKRLEADRLGVPQRRKQPIQSRNELRSKTAAKDKLPIPPRRYQRSIFE